MDTIESFVKRHNIRIKFASVKFNPWMDDFNGKHYEVTLYATFDGKRRQISTFYSAGYGINTQPDSANVFNCIVLDASSVESSRDFYDFQRELGGDMHTYRTCQRQAAKLRRFVGDRYDDLLFNTESL